MGLPRPRGKVQPTWLGPCGHLPHSNDSWRDCVSWEPGRNPPEWHAVVCLWAQASCPVTVNTPCLWSQEQTPSSQGPQGQATDSDTQGEARPKASF